LSVEATSKGDIQNKYEYEKGLYKVKLYCTSYYAKQFHALRNFCCGEETFINSLSRCKSWDARGGKSNATWAKTFDDRFILKEISKLELESFLEVAPLYFEYLSNALFQQVPTILAKIFGVFFLKFVLRTIMEKMLLKILLLWKIYFILAIQQLQRCMI